MYVSSLGIGTYLGGKEDTVSNSYTESVLAALRGGINFIDTSLNYRNQRSEQAIGQAILRVASSRELDRDEYVVCTKAGYLVRGALPAEGLTDLDVVDGMHSMSPVFLRDQLERSRVNLGLETIDVFYLHNPETQLNFIERELFDERLSDAFELLEGMVEDRKIQFYGLATWQGFRAARGERNVLSLGKIDEIARSVAGEGHHCRFIQLPVNLAMLEALTSTNQEVGGENMTVLAAAERLGITIVASASILQGRLARNLPDAIAGQMPGLRTNAQRSIQFVRSTPGVQVALAGMSQPAHVEENLGVADVMPLDSTEVAALLKAAR